GNGWFATGSKDGLYQYDGWAKNVGYTDQAYELNWSKAGEHYVTVDWDQIPHVYSTSALTIYNGVGGNNLTLPPGLSAALFGPARPAPAAPPWRMRSRTAAAHSPPPPRRASRRCSTPT